MPSYVVYRCKFLTKQNTTRFYIGYTGNADRRGERLGLAKMHWTACVKPGSLELSVLHPDLESKTVARALEAWEAARHIDADESHVRGGPWLKPSLPPSDRHEVHVAAKCRSLTQLVAAKDFLGPTSRLAKHMDDLLFAERQQVQPSTEPMKQVKPTAESRKHAKPTEAPMKQVRSRAVPMPQAKSTDEPSVKSIASAMSGVPGIKLPSSVKFMLNMTVNKKRSGTRTSGTQTSGSQRRFNKLPLAKKPAASCSKKSPVFFFLHNLPQSPLQGM